MAPDERAEGQRHAAADHVRQRRRRAAIGNGGQLDAGGAGEGFAGELPGRAGAGDGIGDARPPLRRRHHVRHAVPGQVGADEEHGRRDIDQHHRRQLGRVVGHARHDRRVDGVGAVAEQDRIAVRRAAHRGLRGDHPAGAGPVLDHQRLAPERLQVRLQQARGEIGRATGGIADQQADRLLRPCALRPCGERRGQAGRQQRAAPRAHPGRGAASCPHRFLLHGGRSGAAALAPDDPTPGPGRQAPAAPSARNPGHAPPFCRPGHARRREP